MNRRDALARVAMVMGGTIVGAEAFLSGCKQTAENAIAGLVDFSTDHIAFLDEVGEVILPATPGSGGAKEAMIGAFMQPIVTDCYEEDEQKIFATCFEKIDEASNNQFKEPFMSLDAGQKHDLIVAIDEEAKTYRENKQREDPEHYFTMIKQLTLWGYFTSEVGSRQALRYLPVPGRWEGCVPYKKGDKVWAET